MKNISAVFTIIATTVLCAALLAGCGGEKKMEPVAAGEMAEYKDPGVGFSISYPKGWIQNAQVGQALFYNAQGVEEKFRTPTDPGPIGVEISVRVTKTSDPTGAMNSLKNEWSQGGIQVGQEQTVAAGEAQGVKVPFTANYGEGAIVHSHHVFITADSALYDLGFSGFGDYYNAYAGVFDAVLKSFQLPKPKEKGADETLPSETFVEYDAKMFTFKYPENFNFTNPSKGKNELVIGLRGVRLDCNILIDVFGAQGLSLDKVVDQNKAKYPGASIGQATVGGEAAKTLTLSASKDVSRRVYFAVKNDKVVRITMDWFKPQSTNYLAAYETVINSIKFK